jgi:hypothetical protein
VAATGAGAAGLIAGGGLTATTFGGGGGVTIGGGTTFGTGIILAANADVPCAARPNTHTANSDVMRRYRFVILSWFLSRTGAKAAQPVRN